MRHLYRTLLAVTVAGCLTPTMADDRPTTLRVTFSRPNGEVAALFPGSYGTVLDSAVLNITTPRRSIPNRVKLTSFDSVAFNVDVDTGQVQFQAQIVSQRGTLLFDTTVTRLITPTSGQVDITVGARAPILLVSKSFVITDDARLNRSFITTVYNRGPGVLAWAIQDTLPADCRGNSFCTFTPKGGNIQSFSSVTLTIGVPPGTARPPTFVVTSAAGNVTLP